MRSWGLFCALCVHACMRQCVNALPASSGFATDDPLFSFSIIHELLFVPFVANGFSGRGGAVWRTLRLGGAISPPGIPSGTPESIPGYSKYSPSGSAGFPRSSRCQRWWRGAGGRAGSSETHRIIVARFAAGPRLWSVAECSAGCITHVPFPFFPCPFDGALVRNTWTLKGPKPPGPDNANSSKSKMWEFADRGRLRAILYSFYLCSSVPSVSSVCSRGGVAFA